ncbi:MAG: CPBP family intramembrane glutamic endopeptidase [Myxococcota bacterium]
MNIVSRFLRSAFLDSWREADSQADTAASGVFDWRPAVILTTTAVTLTFASYTGGSMTLATMVGLDRRAYSVEEWELLVRVWWTFTRCAAYVLIPVITIWLMPGERVRDYYLSTTGFFKHVWTYVGLYLLVLPILLAVSQLDTFQYTYPFYRWANQSTLRFLQWQALYAIQFVALEFFFRGYMLKGLSHKFGYGAIFVMLVPYVLIHYPKPLPETLSAVGAGLVLGTLAMRTRSIWGGVLIHIAVALTMDWLALEHCPPPGQGPCH